MANAHVPKFGDWESEDIPYTACFDDARQQIIRPSGSGSGSVKFNPNDPEQNPEAFAAMMTTMQRSRSQGRGSTVIAPDYRDYDFAAASAPRQGHLNTISRNNSNRSTSAEKLRRRAEEQTKHHHHQHRARNHRSGSNNNNNNLSTDYAARNVIVTSESGTERSSSDFSLLKKRQNGDSHGHVRPDQKRNSNASASAHGTTDSSSSASERGHRRHRPGSVANQPSDLDHQYHQRAASIPEFGSWDVNDPKSGEGFTIIFNKIKEEKQISASTKVPAMPRPPPSQPNYLKDQTKQGTSSCLSKICCCLFSS